MLNYLREQQAYLRRKMTILVPAGPILLLSDLHGYVRARSNTQFNIDKFIIICFKLYYFISLLNYAFQLVSSNQNTVTKILIVRTIKWHRKSQTLFSSQPLIPYIFKVFSKWGFIMGNIAGKLRLKQGHSHLCVVSTFEAHLCAAKIQINSPSI